MYRNFTHENRETPLVSVVARRRIGGRSQKHKTHMNGNGESYNDVVLMRQPNESQGGKVVDQGERGPV